MTPITTVLLVLLGLTLCIASVGGAWLALRFMFSELAKRNLFVTFRKDGEIIPIVKGNNGDCVGFIMSVSNYQIDPEGWDVFKGSDQSYATHLLSMMNIKKQEDPGFQEDKLETDEETGEILLFDDDGEPISNIPKNAKEVTVTNGGISYELSGQTVTLEGKPQLQEKLRRKIEEANSISAFEKVFKVTWVGFTPYKVFKYTFRWVKYGQDKKAKDGTPSKDIGMHARDEEVFSLFFRYTQYGLVVTTETGAGSITGVIQEHNHVTESVQVTLQLVIETITVNPKKTLFRTAGVSAAGEWLSAITRDVADKVRLMVGNKEMTWDRIVGNTEECITKGLERIRLEINGETADGIPIPKTGGAVRDYGQRIMKIRLVNVDLTDQDLQRGIEKVFVAKREREERFILAEAKRREAEAEPRGLADALEAIAKIKDGAAMFTAKQYGTGGIKVLTIQNGAGGGTAGPILQLPPSLIDDPPKNAGNP